MFFTQMFASLGGVGAGGYFGPFFTARSFDRDSADSDDYEAGAEEEDDEEFYDSSLYEKVYCPEHGCFHVQRRSQTPKHRKAFTEEGPKPSKDSGILIFSVSLACIIY